MRTTVSLLGVGLVATTVTFGACLIVLRADVGQLQRQHSARIPASQEITYANLSHLRLRVHGRDVQCITR